MFLRREPKERRVMTMANVSLRELLLASFHEDESLIKAKVEGKRIVEAKFIRAIRENTIPSDWITLLRTGIGERETHLKRWVCVINEDGTEAKSILRQLKASLKGLKI